MGKRKQLSPRAFVVESHAVSHRLRKCFRHQLSCCFWDSSQHAFRLTEGLDAVQQRDVIFQCRRRLLGLVSGILCLSFPAHRGSVVASQTSCGTEVVFSAIRHLISGAA